MVVSVTMNLALEAKIYKATSNKTVKPQDTGSLS